MKRFALVSVTIIIAVLALPPLWFAIFSVDPPPDLPPADRRVVLRDGTNMHVLESGHGRPIVLVHGLPGSSYEWRNTTKSLAALGMHAIAIDRIGYGRSDSREATPFTPSSNASELLELLEAMDLVDVTVVGWSYGGLAAMTAAMNQPERIGRLVLVGTAGPDADDAEAPQVGVVQRFFYSDPVLRWREAIPPLGVAMIKAFSKEAFSDQTQPDWWFPGVAANFSRHDTLITFREEMFGMTSENLSSYDPAEIQMPTLLLHGDDDRLVPVGVSRYLASKIENAKLVEYPGASHMLPVTHGQAIAIEIVRFMDTRSSD